MTSIFKMATLVVTLLILPILSALANNTDSATAVESGATGHDHHAGSSQNIHRYHVGVHAPIGVSGGHMHRAGEWMLSYRAMHMGMRGNRSGSKSIAPETIVTTVANRFAGQPMQPATLRVVPTKMTMEMHMLGAMYAPTDTITLMAMTNYQQRSMDHITFMGPSGTTRLGTFTTQARGIGDTSVAALVKLNKQMHATLGVSLPTGSIKEADRILTPMGAMPSARLPYPMQLGSGTYDMIAGATYANSNKLSASSPAWGAQWRSVLRSGHNSAHYSLGDEHALSGWLSYKALPGLDLSVRLAYFRRGNIDGIDAKIMLPVQTADPDRQALERWDLAFGSSWLSAQHKHRISLEVAAPLGQHLDGPQLKQDYRLTLGWEFLP